MRGTKSVGPVRMPSIPLACLLSSDREPMSSCLGETEGIQDSALDQG